MLRLFILHDPVGERLLNESTDSDAVDQWCAAQLRAGRDGKQWEIETGAAQRLLTILSAAAIFPHDGASLNWEEAIEKKWIILLDLSGVPPSHKRALGVNAYVNAGTANVRLFNRTRKKHALVCALDEVGAMRFDTPYLLTSMREDRKCGTSWWLATQTLTDLPPDTTETILGLSDHVWHYLSSGIERAAQDICDKAYRTDIVEAQTERAIHDGWESVTTLSESSNAGLSKHIEKELVTSKNQSEAASKSVNHGYRAKYRIITDVRYKSWNLQRDETKGKISNLGVGSFIYRGMDRWEEGHTILPGDVWTYQNGYVNPKLLPDSHLFPEPTVTLYEHRLRRDPPDAQPTAISTSSTLMEAREQQRQRVRADTAPDSSNRRGAQRDARLVRLAMIGPLWANLLVRIKFFKHRQEAQRRLSILEDKAMIHPLVPHPTDVHHAHRASALWSARRLPTRTCSTRWTPCSPSMPSGRTPTRSRELMPTRPIELTSISSLRSASTALRSTARPNARPSSERRWRNMTSVRTPSCSSRWRAGGCARP